MMKKIYIRLQTKATTKITYIYIYISWYKTKKNMHSYKKINLHTYCTRNREIYIVSAMPQI